MKLALIVVALAVVACKSKSKPKSNEPDPGAGSAPPTMQSFVTEHAAKLSGTLYFRRHTKLAKLEAGRTTTTFDDVGAEVFPSRHALPDGRLVGIASKGDGSAGGEQLVLIGPGTKVERFGPSATQVRNPTVDPKGAWIIVEARFEPSPSLYRIDVATQKSTQLTNHDKGDFQPALLGDGVVFASSRDGDSEIYRIDAEGKRPVRLTAFHRDDFDPVASPDGKLVAFVSDREGRPRIFVMNADGTHLRRLTARIDTSVDEEQPLWSPDGKHLAYIVRTGAIAQVALYDLNSGIERMLSTPDMRHDDVTFSPDGRWIAVSATSLAHKKSIDIQIHAISIEPGSTWLPITRGPDLHRMPRWR